MKYLGFRDEDDSHVAGTVTGVVLGALAGFAVGMLVAQRVGGFSGLASRVRRRGAVAADTDSQPPVADDDYEAYGDDEIESDENSGLEDLVLEAFRNDPILSERAIDIGAIGESGIELAGTVNTEEEAELAVTIARGVNGVSTVVNRVVVGEDEDRARDHARKFAEGDDAHTEARWEGHTVGIGRKRQGNSSDLDRHSSPRAELAEKWTSADAELRDAAEDVEGIAERRARGKAAAKNGVPKADHVPNEASEG